MSIALQADNEPVSIRRFNFSAGEVQVRLLDPPDVVRRWTLTALVRNSDDLLATLLVADAVRRSDDAPIELVLPYLPYARQDRVAWPGEAFSLDLLGRLLRTADFASMTTWDVHSPVAFDTIPGLRSIPARDFVRPHLRPGERVVAPDQGAVERAAACADAEHLLLRAIKRRDPDTGDVRNAELLDALGPDEPAIIVDDICDGGSTFTHLGQYLRGRTRAPLRLYVTHGIFSQGLGELRTIFDEVLTANLFDPAHAADVTVVAAPAPDPASDPNDHGHDEKGTVR